MEPLQPSVDEIADGIYRISTWIPDVTPIGFTFNQFLVAADEPLLFHTGLRGLFPLVAEAVATVLPVESLRWISFGHVEADECGAMNMWLAAAPDSQVAYGALGCDISLNDLCDRAPQGPGRGRGARHRRQAVAADLDPARAPRVGGPGAVRGDHRTLLCGDLFTHAGAVPALTSGDVVEPALAAEQMFHATALAPHTGETIRALGDLTPTTLAIMHGSSFTGDGRQALHDLAAAYDELIAA